MACSRYPIQSFQLNNDLRIVLIGKTGSGKSASGNNILGQAAFASFLSPSSITSRCAKATGVMAGRRVSVIDTPGMFDTKYEEGVVVTEIKRCVYLAAPGPHAFLIVIQLGKFTRELQETVEILQQVFGERAAQYSMVLFTHGDQLKGTPIEDFIRRSPDLRSVVAKCYGKYHVFDNSCGKNTHQVPGLLQKINRMVANNGGTFYTNAMFQEAERAIEEEKGKIQREIEQEMLRAKEQLRAKFKGQQLQVELKKLEQEAEKNNLLARGKAEKKIKYINATLVETGVLIGTAAAGMGGPLCMAMGACVGGAIGALVGLTPVAAKALKKKCAVQ